VKERWARLRILSTNPAIKNARYASEAMIL
jgi:hypothetical protein